MSILEQSAKKTKGRRAPIVLIHGEPGVGKTTLAYHAKSALINCENGLGPLEQMEWPYVTKYLETWPEIMAVLDEMAAIGKLPGGAQALAIDTLDWLMKRLIQFCNYDLDKRAQNSGDENTSIIATIGSAQWGFFKGRDVVENMVRQRLIPALNRINGAGYPIILLAHSQNQKWRTAEGHELRQAMPAMDAFIVPTFVEWVDAVLYAYPSGDPEDRDTLMQTQGTPLISAKNRYGMPPVMKLDWRLIVKSAISQQTAYMPKQ